MHPTMLRLDTSTPFVYRFGLYSAIFAAAAMVGAYIAEYFFELKPCSLCIYQRVPYMTITIIGFMAMMMSLVSRYAVYFTAVIFALFFIEAALAFYHMGVEFHWFHNVASCENGMQFGMRVMTLEQVKEATLVEAVRCDQPAFVFLGLSMAGWNMLYALGCLFVLGSFYLSHRKHDHVS